MKKRRSELPDSVKLTGETFEKDDPVLDERDIPESEREKYESDGWELTDCFAKPGSLRAWREIKHKDGDIELHPRLDMFGRSAVAGRHTNYGHSGYFKGYIYVEGRRRKLNLWQLCPNEEHHYSTQGNRRQAFEAVAEIIRQHVGMPTFKVKGGWAFKLDEER